MKILLTLSNCTVCNMLISPFTYVRKYKIPPSHLANGAALISDSIVISQAPAEASGPWTRGQCVARCACLLPQLMVVPNCTAW